jgi:hypothetical protein
MVRGLRTPKATVAGWYLATVYIMIVAHHGTQSDTGLRVKPGVIGRFCEQEQRV